MDEIKESQADILCTSCGLCCTGHLFIWAKLRPSELDPAEALGMHVFRSDPSQRGFSQPCPLWQGDCTIHASPHYPRVCRAYQCRLLKQMLGESISLPDALAAVQQAKGMIHELETLLPASSTPNFRERLVARLEALEQGKTSPSQADTDQEFRRQAAALLMFYETVFGVTDVVDKPGEE
ncbi:MAG: YkgJ family cysteine cluster protein [Bacteroidota bacterium]